ncbi:MAG TPA: carbon storage regulator [Dehalococcoidia bacterium]|nr:carbon storage regulator [Dehalococcoidia bacterium]
MLILTRKPDQRIIINDNIVISVLAVDGDRVKLGIEAPAEVPVLREEVQRSMALGNRRAELPTAACDAPAPPDLAAPVDNPLPKPS